MLGKISSMRKKTSTTQKIKPEITKENKKMSRPFRDHFHRILRMGVVVHIKPDEKVAYYTANGIGCDEYKVGI